MPDSRIIAYMSLGESPVLLCDSAGSTLLSSDLSKLLDFLIFSCSATVPSTALRVFWDLDRSVSAILGMLPEASRRELSSPARRTFRGPHKIYYIPGKLFSVRKSGQEVAFYDLSQYFPEEPEPSNIHGLQQKADLLLSTLDGLGIESSGTLSSPVAVATASGLLSECSRAVPTVFDAPENTLDAYELALQCTPREWVCNYQVGHWGQDECWSYDIASAYPHHASQLIDLRDCVFTRSESMDDAAYYGFLVGDFTVYPDSPYAFCSPFLANRGDGVLVNFVGTVSSYPCLLDEVRVLLRHGLGEFHLRYGWFIKPASGARPGLPFAATMSRLYQARALSSTASFFLKRVMTGVVGKLLETRLDEDGNIIKYGDLYNSIYHAIATTRTRLQVFDFLVNHEIVPGELVHVGVDGMKLSRCLYPEQQQGMGKWCVVGSQPTFVLSPGAVVTPIRNYKGTGYAELRAQLSGKPQASKYGNNGDIDLRKLFLNQHRVFPRMPRSGHDLLGCRYQSEAVLL